MPLRASVTLHLGRLRAAVWAAPVALGALVALFVVTGIRGVDFGHHWDEVEWQLKPVQEMVATGLLLPRATIYPAMTKWLVLLPTLPVALGALFREGATPQKVQAAMKAVVDAPDYLLTARSVFVVVSSLALVWVYLAARALGRKPWEAWLAAAGLGLSWEYAYHARWLATDCILVQFSALTLYFLALFASTQRARWLELAAVSAGLAIGSKYQGVLLLVPVLVLGDRSSRTMRPGRRARQAVTLLGWAALAYLVTTPATLLEPFKFFSELARVSEAYQRRNAGYGVPNPWVHLVVALGYLALTYFSPCLPLALLLFAACLYGGWLWFRADRRVALLLVGVPAFSLSLLALQYRTVVARNYLFLTPFLALLMARGLTGALARLEARVLRYAAMATLALAFLAQAGFLLRAAESIRTETPASEVRGALSYVHDHAGTSFGVSERVRQIAESERITLPANVISNRGAAAEQVFFAIADGPGPFKWRSNDPFLTEAVFGPREVNFNWYSSWAGRDRVLVMDRRKAESTHVSLTN